MRPRGASLPCALALLAACGGATSRPVASHEQVGMVSLGDTLFVVGRGRIEIQRGGGVVSRVDAPDRAAWQSVATILAPDHTGRWVVAVADGALWRITPAGDREPVGARLGVGDRRALAIDGAGSAFAIGFADGIVLSRDGSHLLEIPGAPAASIAVALDRVAVAHDDGIEVLDLAAGKATTYPIANATFVAFRDPDHPRLVVQVGQTVYSEDHGKLRRITTPARKVVVGGARTWLLAGTELYVLEGHSITRTGITGVRDAVGAPNGDLWTMRESGELTRFPGEPASDPAWQADVAPVFQRACAKCHLPGGPADHDLSSPTAWQGERSEIVHRVLETRSMPPSEAPPLSDADRAALAHWLKR